MGKSRKTDREYTREQRLTKENRQLKRELAHLRKQISKTDLDRFETVSKMCSDFEESERFQENNPEINGLELLKKEWSCHTCNVGWLEITLYSKADGQTYYYRRCVSCPYRTRGQRYDAASVKGILKK